MTTRILVLYYSRHGSIAKLATHIAAGVESIHHCEAVLRTVPPVSTVCEAVETGIPASGDIYAAPHDLETCHGIALGSPTRFGTIASPLKYFFDQTTPQWLNGALNGKPAAVFTSTGSMHGGQESTLLSMMLPLIHHGSVIVGVPFTRSPLGRTQSGGTPYGASHVAGKDGANPITGDEKEIAGLLGRRVARCAVALSGSMF